MPTTTPEGRYFCESCTARYDEVGDCPSCPEEPLLDLLDEDVLLMLRSFDDERWRKRMGVYTGISAVVCIPALILAAPFKHFALPAYGFVAMGMAGALMASFPPQRKTPDMGQVH